MVETGLKCLIRTNSYEDSGNMYTNINLDIDLDLDADSNFYNQNLRSIVMLCENTEEEDETIM